MAELRQNTRVKQTTHLLRPSGLAWKMVLKPDKVSCRRLLQQSYKRIIPISMISDKLVIDLY